MTITRLTGVVLLLAAAMLLGCAKVGESAKAKSTKKTDTDAAHEHGKSPHGGTIIEFGKHHAEFCVDHAKKEATVYILSGSLKKNVPISANQLLLIIKTPAFQADLVAAPQQGDPEGKSSRFVAIHENLGKVQEFEGTVSGEFDGKPYLGDFKEEAHDEHHHEAKK